MVHDVLDSDVQFAQGLIATNQSDDEILSALCRRGVAADKAFRLVQDLRNKPSGKFAAALTGPSRGITQASSPVAPVEMQKSVEHKRERRLRHRPKSVPWWFLIIAAIFIWAIAYCLLHEENSASDYEKHDLPAKPSPKDFDEKR